MARRRHAARGVALGSGERVPRGASAIAYARALRRIEELVERVAA